MAWWQTRQPGCTVACLVFVEISETDIAALDVLSLVIGSIADSVGVGTDHAALWNQSIVWAKCHDGFVEVHLLTHKTAINRHQAFSAGMLTERAFTYSESGLACVS